MPKITTGDNALSSLMNTAEVGLSLVQMPDLNNDPFSDLQMDILLYGPANVGKTTCAMTISEHIPVDATFPLKQRTLLKDVVSVDFDTTARFSREIMGAYCPSMDLSQLTGHAPINIIKNMETGVISHSTVMPGKGFERLGQLTMDNWEPYIFDGLRSLSNQGVKTVILDGMTTYDRVTGEYFGTIYKPGFDFSTALRTKLITFHTFARTLGMRCIFTAHPRMPVGIEGSNDNAKVQQMSDNMHQRLEAQGAGKKQEVFVDITTSAAAVFRANTVARWPIVNEGSPENPRRVLYPYGNETWEGGCKLHGLNAKGEAPNLRAIINKARAFMEKQMDLQKQGINPQTPNA